METPTVTPVSGENTQAAAPAPDTLSALEARIKSAEAQPEIGKRHQTAGENATSAVQAQVPANPPSGEAPKEANKDGLQQFRDKDGEVSTDKILKANEHLEKAIREKEDLIRQNKELLGKFSKASEEAKRTAKAVDGQRETFQVRGGGLPEEDRKKLWAEVEKNPDALLDYVEQIAEQKARRYGSKVEEMEQERILTARANELDDLVRAGNTWIKTEGLGRFEEVFKQRPFLLQSPTPYVDALRFIDPPSNGTTAAPAQGGKGTPILGAGHAVPPPSSAPPVTPDARMKQLSAELQNAMRDGDGKRQQELWAEYERLYKGAHR